MHNALDAAAALLPKSISEVVIGCGDAEKGVAEEIRLRRGFPPGLLLPDGEKSLGCADVSAADIAHVLDRASRSSLHFVEKELARGFITAPGGLRIGVCGSAAGEKGERMREFSSLAIRIPHEIPTAGREAINLLRPFTSSSVLIIAPPGGGKTTFLRNLIRAASDSGRRVSLCDERYELAAVHQGAAGFGLGRHTDILSGFPKAEGISMLLRAMNPEIIAVDEISAEEDIKAVELAAGCGAAIFATAHASSPETMKKRRDYRRILESGIFDKLVVISGKGRRDYAVVDLC